MTHSTNRAPVSTIKRWIASIGAIGAVATLVVVFGVVSFTVRETGDGSDPDRAFSPTQEIPTALDVELEWAPDAEDLVRPVEATTRGLVGSMWIRSDDALARAADGDTSGLDVWFVDAALDATHGRFERSAGAGDDGAVRQTLGVAPALVHRLRVDFYSLDGQVMVLSVDTVRLRPTGSSLEGDAGTEEVVERIEAMAVLSDGNWRIRHLERLTPRENSAPVPS